MYNGLFQMIMCSLTDLYDCLFPLILNSSEKVTIIQDNHPKFYHFLNKENFALRSSTILNQSNVASDY